MEFDKLERAATDLQGWGQILEEAMPRLGKIFGATCGIVGQVMEGFTRSNIKRAKPTLRLDPHDPNPIIAVEAPICAEP